jgi:UDP-glucose 4-epimerase
MKTILVTGGAGYIGSHAVKMLLNANYQVVILDNLSTGYRDAVLGGHFILGDVTDKAKLEQLFTDYSIDGVMHFAASVQVEESVQNPNKYYQNNVVATLNLLDAMLAHQVKTLIFSSTAAIFGEPQYIPVDEQHPKQPLNPYGQTKWIAEQILADYDKAYGLKSVCLRYFNAAGAEGEIIERHNPVTHLIPLVLEVAAGKRKFISVYGQDYNTSDGTCIRDYIHINDLCQAHLLALEQLLAGARSNVYNLGNGIGFSVKQVIETAKKVTGKNISITITKRRSGDSAHLVANSKQAKELLGWQPQYVELSDIIRSSWKSVGWNELANSNHLSPQI